MAAEVASLKFFAGYPITPASEIIHEMVNKKHIKVLQMEDEIASINARYRRIPGWPQGDDSHIRPWILSDAGEHRTGPHDGECRSLSLTFKG